MTDFKWFEGSNPNRREFVALGLGAFVVATIPFARGPGRLVGRTLPAMGTIVEVAVVHRDPRYAEAAIDAAFDIVIEFGGGIGKGEGPADKRPNLESIVKRSLKWREHQAQYLPAINAATIRATAQQLLGG